MRNIFHRNVFKNLLIAVLFVTFVLTFLIMLVQSIRFLELVMHSGASINAFVQLMMLSLPRFIEAVLPVSMMVGILFLYNKIIMDSEVVIMRSAGQSPLDMARPALFLTGIMMVTLFIVAAYIAPICVAKMQLLRQDIKAQYSSMFLREGVFTQVGRGLTAYIRTRNDEGELIGLMIHDARPEEDGQRAYTVIAKRGVALGDESGQKIIVYDGVRQEFNPERGTLSRLSFDQYTIDIPEEQGDGGGRWREPSERTFPELWIVDPESDDDGPHVRQFYSEGMRRLSLPFLLLSCSMIGVSCLLLGAMDRRGLNRRILLAALLGLGVHGAFMFFFNLAKNNVWADYALFSVASLPAFICFYILSGFGDGLRRRKLRPSEKAKG